jgi:hypothetical protein
VSSDHGNGGAAPVRTPEAAADDEMAVVQLLGSPLPLGQRATEHYNDIFREFALLAADQPHESAAVPRRLLALIEALGRRYPRQQDAEQQREEALARGERSMDILISVPRSAGAASAELDAMLDETDEFCRDGKLLTLAAPDDVVAFRRWYLQEVIVQTGGGPATPWPGGLD